MTKYSEVDGVTPSKRRRVLRSAAGFSAAAAVIGTLGLAAGPAGAADSITTTGAANNIIVGSGSSTTYNMMVNLDSLYNQAPGCTLVKDFASSTDEQPLDFSCVTDSKNLVNQAPAVGVTPNPYNDAVVEEAPIGSSNGILQLESATGDTTALQNKYNGSLTFNVFTGANFARSSRVNGSTDDKGLNFVAYARDGVDWVHYSSVGNKATASDVPGNLLSKTELTDIYKGEITNWDQVGGANAPIVVFSAQEGSGTQSTWKTFVGADPSAKSGTMSPNCVNNSVLTLGSEPSSTSQCNGPVDIFENETSQLGIGSLPTTLTDPTVSSSSGGYGLAAAVTADTPPTGVTETTSGDTVTVYKTYTGAFVKPTQAAPIFTPTSVSNWSWGYTVAKPFTGAITGTGASKQTPVSQTFTLKTPTANTVLGDSIFFYSSGLFAHQCELSGQKKNSAATCTAGNYINYGVDPTGKTTFQLGQIGGSEAPTNAVSGVIPANSCAASSNPAEDANPCLPSEGSVLSGDFPDVRYVYNVYGNGSEPTSVPAATGATLNYVSETGFLCTSQTATEHDPTTDATYRSEIESDIYNAGFFPLYQWNGSAWASASFDEGNVTHKSSTIYASAYSSNANDANGRYQPFLTPASTETNGDPVGYCLVTSTDSGGTTPANG